MIRVVLVEDQTLVRRGIRSLLEMSDDIEVVGEAADGDEGVKVIRETRPDVVLLDIMMPKKDGLGVLRELQAQGHLPATILLTTFDDDEALFTGMRAGARGYLLKDVSLEHLTEAIRKVHCGETLIRPAVTERALRSLSGGVSAGLSAVKKDFDLQAVSDPLTRRELEILRLMAGGYSNREIGEALGTAEATVKAQASSILSKLGVRDRTRAVLRALERGYI